MWVSGRGGESGEAPGRGGGPAVGCRCREGGAWVEGGVKQAQGVGCGGGGVEGEATEGEEGEATEGEGGWTRGVGRKGAGGGRGKVRGRRRG